MDIFGFRGQRAKKKPRTGCPGLLVLGFYFDFACSALYIRRPIISLHQTLRCPLHQALHYLGSACLHQTLHYFVEDCFAGADALVGQGAEGLVDEVQQVGEAGLFGVQVEDAGEDFVLGVRVHQG